MGEKLRSATRLFIICLLLGVSCWSCSTKAQKLADFVARGNQFLAAGDPVRAVLEFKNALQIDPQNVPASLGLGRSYVAEKKYQKAYRTFSSMVLLKPDLDEARIELARLLAMGKQNQKALHELDQLKNPEKFKKQVKIIKARVLLSQNHPKQAVALLTQIEGGKQDKEVQKLLAFSLENSGAKGAAQKAAQQWVALDPKDPAPYLFLARQASLRGDKQQAAAQLERMVQAIPDDDRLALLRAQALEEFGLLEQAQKAYGELPDKPELLKAQADFWIRQRNSDKARQILQDLLAKEPADTEAVIKMVTLMSERNEFTAAYALLDKTLRMSLPRPEKGQLLVARATLQGMQGHWEKAKTGCEGALAEDQGNMDAHLLLAKILLSRGEPEAAENHLNQVAAARPKDVDVQILLARCQMLNNKATLAADTLSRAVTVNPNSTRLRVVAVHYYLKEKDYDQAVKILDQGLALHPDEVILLKTRGRLAAIGKDYAGAARNFRKIIRLRPDSPLGYMEMGQLALLEVKPQKAIQWFDKSLVRENGWQLAVPALVNVYLVKGAKDRALELLRDQIRKRPDSPLLYYYLGQTLLVAKDLAGGKKAFAKAAELKPDWLDPYRGLATIYLQQGKIDDAIALVEKTYQKQPSFTLLVQLAVLYEQAGRYDDSIRAYKELLNRHNHAPDFMNNLAYLYAEQAKDPEHLQKAADLIKEALHDQPENPGFLDTAAWIAYRKGDLNKARGYMRQALDKAPDQGVINLHAAVIFWNLGNNEKAWACLDKALGDKTDPRVRQRASVLKRQWQG